MRSPPTVRSRYLPAALAAAAAVTAGAAPARATIVDRGTFSGTESDVPGPFCGFDLVRDSTFSGSFRIRADSGL